MTCFKITAPVAALGMYWGLKSGRSSHESSEDVDTGFSGAGDAPSDAMPS